MQLDWIDENERSSHKERDAAAGKLIRRRAIQAAALTRQKQRQQISQAKCLTQQVQSWVIKGSFPCSSSSRRSKTEDYEVLVSAAECRMLSSSAVTPPLITSIYSLPSPPELLQHLVDIFRKPSSTRSAFEKLAIQSSAADEQVRYFKTLALTDAEYLQAISGHYGTSACLDAAIDCLTARINDVLAGTVEQVTTLRLYTKALQVLQRSIATNHYRERFEIYYAIPLLVLFELLNSSDQLTYLTHGRGAVHLLHFIGPDGIQTELDKTLLAMQSDIMVVENLQDGYAHCCATSEWHHALRQAMKHDLGAGATRSQPNIHLNIIATALPGAFNDVEIEVTRSYGDSTENLQSSLQIIRIELEGWQQRWQPILCATSGDRQNQLTRKVLLAIFWMYTAISYRLLAAATGSSEQRLTLESKALDAANNALLVAANSALHNNVGQTRLDIVAKFVRSIIETSDAWQQTIRCTLPHQLIDRRLFMDWCVRIDRRTIVGP